MIPVQEHNEVFYAGVWVSRHWLFMFKSRFRNRPSLVRDAKCAELLGLRSTQMCCGEVLYEAKASSPKPRMIEHRRWTGWRGPWRHSRLGGVSSHVAWDGGAQHGFRAHPSPLPDSASSNCTLHFLLLQSPSTPIELERLLNNPYKPLADLTVDGA